MCTHFGSAYKCTAAVDVWTRPLPTIYLYSPCCKLDLAAVYGLVGANAALVVGLWILAKYDFSKGILLK